VQVHPIANAPIATLQPDFTIPNAMKLVHHIPGPMEEIAQIAIQVAILALLVLHLLVHLVSQDHYI